MHLLPFKEMLKNAAKIVLSGYRRGAQHGLWTSGNSLQGTSLPHLIVFNSYKISWPLHGYKWIKSWTAKEKKKKEAGAENNYKLDKNDTTFYSFLAPLYNKWCGHTLSPLQNETGTWIECQNLKCKACGKALSLRCHFLRYLSSLLLTLASNNYITYCTSFILSAFVWLHIWCYLCPCCLIANCSNFTRDCYKLGNVHSLETAMN